jgi:hypothetical protein
MVFGTSQGVNSMRLQFHWMAIHLIAVSLALAGVTLTWAQDSSLVTVQPEHKLLARLSGEWGFEKRTAPQDGAKPELLGKGTVSAELIGEFFVVSRWTGEVYGTEYKASQSLGYSSEQKKYTGYWIVSTMSYRWELSGAVDEKSRELVVATVGPCPTGGNAAFRERYQFNSADAITIVGEMQKGDKWVAFITTHLMRKR